MIKVKISEFEFEITNKLIDGKDVKLENPEKRKVFQMYILDEEGEIFEHLASFDTLEEAIELQKLITWGY